MPRYLDPKADVVFKKIFGEHPHLLMSFLNAVLPLPDEHPIIELSYLPTEQIPSIPVFKRTIADVKCKDSTGRIFIVEMQIEWTDSFKQRLLFGASQAVVKQLGRGESYHLLHPVYGLGIVADIFDRETPTWYHHYQLVKQDIPERETIEHLQLIFVELPKFPIVSPKEKQLRLLWLQFLREINEKTETPAPELLAVKEIAEALKLAEQAAYSPSELNAYEEYWDSVRTEKTLLHGKYEAGVEKGRAEGKLEGLAEGDKRTQLAIAKKLKTLGLSAQQIFEATGLHEND
jgi:predicted transposase/invertase (TIGR01784 family)